MSRVLFKPRFRSFPYSWVAVPQIEAHFTDQGLSIVGYYHANERLRDQEMASVGKKVADQIASRCPEAVALLVDCQKLDKLLDPDPPCVLKVCPEILEACIDKNF